VAFGLAIAALIGVGFFGHVHEYFDALGSFRLHLAVLAGIWAVWCLVRRRWRAAIVGAVTGAAAVATLGPIWGPAGLGGLAEKGDVTLLAVNIARHNTDPPALRRFLIGSGADVIVTIETFSDVIGDPEPIRRLYPHVLMSGHNRDAMRVAIWSRFPLSEGRVFLRNIDWPTGARAIVSPPGRRPFALAGVHLSWPVIGKQHRQARGIGRMLPRHTEAAVITGDFNAVPWAHTMRLAARAADARMLGGLRRSWRGRYPLFGLPELWGLPIDHTLVRGAVGVARIRTVRVPGSDHWGQWLELRLPAT